MERRLEVGVVHHWNLVLLQRWRAFEAVLFSGRSDGFLLDMLEGVSYSVP